jgi:glycosyltransferase involved in cell wall biosynthesis
MRILYLSQYFPPEAGATQTRAFEMARNFVRLVHSVTILTEFPNHPSGRIPAAYRGKLYERESLAGIDVIRVWVKASPTKDFRNRLLFYLSYMVSATLAGLFLARGRYDLIYCSSPPLFTGAAGLALSRIRRLPFFFEVRDLWPASAIALGELTNPLWIRWAQRLEGACYRRAACIVVVTRGIQQTLIKSGLADEKLLVIPNGANLDEFQYQPAARQQLRAEFGWQDDFIVIYAGIFGLAQGLETVIQAAQLLRDRPGIRFLLIGEGPTKADIAALVENLGLTNVTILPEQPAAMMPAYLSTADLAVAPLRRLEIFKGALPSKIFDAWACQRPVVISIDGEARQVVESAQGGLFVPPEDPQALAQALITLSAWPDYCAEMGANGRAYAALHYNRAVLAEKLVNRLENELAKG